MKYCCYCANPVVLRVPENDNLPRYTCERCGVIHYQNPKIVTGCIPKWEDKILICRRAIEPRYGLWTVPAGFLENNETLAEAARRETLEEAEAAVTNLALHSIFNIAYINQVYIMFSADLAGPKASPGAESLEVKLVPETDVPWSELAFPVIRRSLELYFADLRQPAGQVHMVDLEPRW